MQKFILICLSTHLAISPSIMLRRCVKLAPALGSSARRSLSEVVTNNNRVQIPLQTTWHELKKGISPRQENLVVSSISSYEDATNELIRKFYDNKVSQEWARAEAERLLSAFRIDSEKIKDVLIQRMEQGREGKARLKFAEDLISEIRFTLNAFLKQ